jgi:hypothetical protein
MLIYAFRDQIPKDCKDLISDFAIAINLLKAYEQFGNFITRSWIELDLGNVYFSELHLDVDYFSHFYPPIFAFRLLLKGSAVGFNNLL